MPPSVHRNKGCNRYVGTLHQPALSGSPSTVRSDWITTETEPDMIVDCDRCEVRGVACQDCVITVLLGAPPSGVELDGTERLALDTLAEAGMVPHLQLVDRDGDDRTTGKDTCVRDHLRDGAERCTTDCERSRRRVG
jgi:hypothetical protein